MSEPVPFQLLEAIRTQLSVIRVADGYATDIGSNILLNALQRDINARPSIAIGCNNGDFDLSGRQTPTGQPYSRGSRALTVVIEAAVNSSARDFQQAGHDMLEDFERAWAIKTCGAPRGVGSIRLGAWTILDRPEGLQAVVLRIEGEAIYHRTTQTAPGGP